MKKIKTITLSLLAAMLFSVSSFAQEEESSSIFDAGMDIYSSYIWRGAKFGTGPAFQPWMTATVGGLEIGAWGSVCSGGLSEISGNDIVSPEGFEMDLYASYGFDFGLSLGVTDYYFGGDWTTFDENHYIEPAVGYEIADFSFTGAYMFMPDFEDGDMYLEVGYSIAGLDLALGAGDGQYTITDDDPEGDFNICNLTLGTSKEIKLTDSFSLPLSGAVTLNPTTGGFFIYVGISL